MSAKRKRLCLKEKLAVIEACEKQKLSGRALAKQFKVGKTQIAQILKKKEKLLEMWSTNVNRHTKKIYPQHGSYRINGIIFEWYCRMRTLNKPISGVILQKKALEVARELGERKFKASHGWLENFRIRHNVSYKTVADEASSATNIKDYQNQLPVVCHNYDERDIFSLDETGLFYKAFPEMVLNHETCAAGEIPEERLTVMLCANMIGEFELPIIIGNVDKHHFNGIDIQSFGLQWRNNITSWMTRKIMTEWLISFDQKMNKQDRNVILLCDNAISHPKLTLNNVKIHFLPSITTCQPLHQGIIKKFKYIYRKKILRHLLSTMQDDRDPLSLTEYVTTLDAIVWIVASIKEIPKETVRNSFLKSGIRMANKLILKNTQENCDRTEILNLLKDFKQSNEDYIDIDDNLSTEDTSTDIIQIMRNQGINSSVESEEEEIDKSIVCPDAIKYCENLKNFCIKRHDTTGFKLIADLQMHLEDVHCEIYMRKREI